LWNLWSNLRREFDKPVGTCYVKYAVAGESNAGGKTQMAFEIFSRKVNRGGSPSVSFTTLGRIAFNKSATTQFEKDAVENVLLMWDESKRTVGIRPITKKDQRAYKVHYGKKGNGCGFSASTFLRYIGYNISETRSIPAKWDVQEGMFLIEVPEEYLQKTRQNHLTPVAVETNKRQIRQA
jgi:hypothetical protein